MRHVGDTATYAWSGKLAPVARLHHAVFAFAVLASCDGDRRDRTPSRPPLTLAAGDFSIRVDLDAREIVLLGKDATLLRLPQDALELGTVPSVDDGLTYDPVSLVIPSALQPPPEGLEFLSPTRFDPGESSATSLTILLSYDATRHAKLTFEVAHPGNFRVKLVPDAGASTVAYFRLRPRVDSKEGFYGLGEYYDEPNHRGKVRAMQLEVDGELESNYNEAHVPVPLLIGTRGWGLFVDSPYPGVFSVAKDADDLVETTFGTGVGSSAGLTFHLYGASHPLDVTKHYYDDTGYPRLPARWAIGPLIWRDENKDQAEVESDIAKIRDLDLATSGIWIDRPYATGVNTFDFNAPQFPDPPKMIKLAHDMGLRMALWHTPYLDEKDPSTQTLRDEANAKGFYPKKVGLLLNKWGKPIDLTNPTAFTWWQEHVRLYEKMGIEGYKLDYGEDVVPGLTSKRGNIWNFADGSDERTMHSLFQRFYHRVYDETLPKEGGFLLCRHGTIGDQKNVSVIWPGDLDATFAKHREKIDTGKDKYVAVGGLPASIVAGLSLGPSGFPFYGADTGGYRHSPPDKELFVRWFEQTALSTVMQIGNSSSNVPWDYDAETLDLYRAYTRLHLRLFPYEWTYAQNLAKDGRPIARPLGLAFPELGAHPSDTYMFGDALLVAPVVENAKRDRSVTFPKGRWTHWFTGKIFDGGTTTTVPAPLGELPLFVLEGSIVPLLRPTIDTMAATTDPTKVDSYATTPGVLYARVAPGPASSFVVFDGATLKQEKSSASLTLGTKDGAEFKQGFFFEVIAIGTKPASITSDGAALAEQASLAALEAATSGFFFSTELGGTLYVKAPAGEHAIVVK